MTVTAQFVWCQDSSHYIELDSQYITVLMDSLDGFTTQVGQAETLQRPDYTANTLRRIRYDSRTVSFSLMVTGSSAADYESRVESIVKAFNPENEGTYLNIYVPALAQRVNLYGVTASGFPKVTKQSIAAGKVDISIICPDGRFYRASDVALAPITVSSPSSQFNNPGDAWSVITSMTMNAATVSNTASTYTITSASGQSVSGCVLTTDRATGAVNVTYSGVTALYKVNPACELSKFQIAAGNNTITGASSVTYIPTWRGVQV